LNAIIAYNVTAGSGRTKSVFFFKRPFREIRLKRRRQAKTAKHRHGRTCFAALLSGRLTGREGFT